MARKDELLQELQRGGLRDSASLGASSGVEDAASTALASTARGEARSARLAALAQETVRSLQAKTNPEPSPSPSPSPSPNPNPKPNPNPSPYPKQAHAATFFGKDVRRPLQWLPLCAPPNVSSRASAVVPPHTTKGLPLGLVSRLPMRAGRLMVAPTLTL